jgi:hypothetical protein
MDDTSKLDWVVRIGDPGDFRNTHRVQFADEGPWVELLGFGWANIDTQDISIRPRKGQLFGREPHEHAIAQWTMAIHLLGLGLGWNDIGLGLRKWREARYELGQHAILDFMWSNFGQDIEALEIYFGFFPRSGIANALEQIKLAEYDPDTDVQLDMSLQEEYELRRQSWLRNNEKSSVSLGTLLLKENDGLHLDDHCANSFLETGWDLMGSQMQRDYEGLTVVSTPYYQGWAHRLAMFNQTRQTATSTYGPHVIEVHLVGIGSLGKFVWNAETQRWWRSSVDSLSAYHELKAHHWGQSL